MLCSDTTEVCDSKTLSKTFNSDVIAGVMLDVVVVVVGAGKVSVVVIVVMEGVTADVDVGMLLRWLTSLNQLGGGKSGGPFWRNDIISRLSATGINRAW